MLICQNKIIKDIYYGGRKIQTAYLGSEKIFGRNFWKFAGGDTRFSPEACLLIDGKLLYCTPSSCKVIEENVTDALFFARNEFLAADKGWLVYFIKDNFCYDKTEKSSGLNKHVEAGKMVGIFSGKHSGHSEYFYVPICLQKNGQVSFYYRDVNEKRLLIFEEQTADFCYSSSENLLFVLTTAGQLFKLNYKPGADVYSNNNGMFALYYHSLDYQQIAEKVTSISQGHKGVLYRNTAGEIWHWTSESTNLLLTTQSENVKLFGSDFLIDGIIYRCPTDANGLLCSSEGGFDTTADGVSIKDGKLYNTTDLQNPVEIAGTPENVTELQGVVAKTSDNRFYLVLIDFSAVELITTSTE